MQKNKLELSSCTLGREWPPELTPPFDLVATPPETFRGTWLIAPHEWYCSCQSNGEVPAVVAVAKGADGRYRVYYQHVNSKDKVPILKTYDDLEQINLDFPELASEVLFH